MSTYSMADVDTTMNNSIPFFKRLRAGGTHMVKDSPWHPQASGEALTFPVLTPVLDLKNTSPNPRPNSCQVGTVVHPSREAVTVGTDLLISFLASILTSTNSLLK